MQETPSGIGSHSTGADTEVPKGEVFGPGSQRQRQSQDSTGLARHPAQCPPRPHEGMNVLPKRGALRLENPTLKHQLEPRVGPRIIMDDSWQALVSTQSCLPGTDLPNLGGAVRLGVAPHDYRHLD